MGFLHPATLILLLFLSSGSGLCLSCCGSNRVMHETNFEQTIQLEIANSDGSTTRSLEVLVYLEGT
jgi:hypothetical protein